MTCRDMNTYLDRVGDAPLPAEAAEHLTQCSRCRNLYLRMRPAPPATKRGQLAPLGIPLGILDDLKPVRPVPPGPVLVLLCLIPAAVAFAAGVAMWGTGGWQAQTASTRVALFGAICVSGWLAAYALSREMIPGSRRSIAVKPAAAVAALVFVAVVGIGFHRQYDLASISGSCFLRGLAISALTFVLGLGIARRGAWLERAAGLRIIGALAACSSLLVLTTYCPVLSAAHVFGSHLGAVAVTIAASWLLGRALR